MTLEEERVEEFTREFHREYENRSRLKDLCNIVDYTHEFRHIEYYQIGKRILLPIEIVNHEIPEIIIRNFVRPLVNSERDYLLNQLQQSAKQNQIHTAPIEDFSSESIRQWCSQVNQPDHLFLPLDSEYSTNLFDRQISGELGGEFSKVQVGDYDLEVHWVPLDSGIENGYLLSSENVTFIQKWFDDSAGPEAFDHIRTYDKFSMNRPLMLYFGEDVIYDEEEEEDRFREKIDFLYRIVLSKVLVSSDDALLLEPQKELEFESD